MRAHRSLVRSTQRLHALLDERALLYSIIELMALGIPAEHMPTAERALLAEFLGNGADR